VAYPQSISFAALPAISADVRLTRGTSPGVVRIRLPQDQVITAESGNLILSSDETCTFRGCIPDMSTLRVENNNGRREYSVLVYDRRAQWKGSTVSGKYNVRLRDNTIEPGTEKKAGPLADIALEAAGEGHGSTITGDIYPPGDWDAESVPDALDGLCKILPVHVCRNADDSFKVMETGYGDGLDATVASTIPDYAATIEAGPKTVEIECGKTWYDCGIELEAVGMETDGTYVPIDDLSYKPALGWDGQWPTLFSGVAPQFRSLAFLSVYRVYQIKTPQTFPFGITLEDIGDIELDDHRCVFGVKHQPPAVVKGVYYPYSDHYFNVAQCPINSAWFRVDKPLGAVVFDYPVWAASGFTCVRPAELQLHAGFHLRDTETGEWKRERFTVERDTGTGKRIYKEHHLWKAHSFDVSGCGDGTEHTNDAELTAESQFYLDAWENHWDTVKDKRQQNYAGIHPLSLSGTIAHITMRAGRGQSPITRASEHYEHRPG